MDARIEQDQPYYLHQLFELIHEKANPAGFQDNLSLPEFGVAFDLTFQGGEALVVLDSEISSREVVVEPGCRQRIVALEGHEHGMNRSGA